MREAAYPSAWIKRDAGLGRWKETPPMLKIVENEAVKEEGYTLDALAREGARRMLMSALEEEVGAYVERHAEARDGKGGGL